MKKQLQEKLNNYKANLSRATFEPAAVGRFGLASTAALAAMVAAPVELGAQVVCGDMGAPMTSVADAEELLSFLGINAVFFDFDGDNVNDLQIVYAPGAIAVSAVGEAWAVQNINSAFFGTAPRTLSAIASDVYLYINRDAVVMVPLSGGGGFGFITFDVDANPPFTPYPLTGQVFATDSPLPAMWGAQTSNADVSEIMVNSGLTDCPIFPTVLPVELTGFSANSGAKSIRLEWTTATETANAGFEVERSTDGVSFRTLQFVEGQGDATEANQYSFEDQDVVAGNEYLYRLKQINFDGTFQYSEVVSAELLRAGLQASVFPNPVAGGSAQLRIAAPNDEAVTVTVFNGNGQRMSVATESVREGSNRLSLDLSDLTAGIYFVKLEQAGETTYEKFVVE